MSCEEKRRQIIQAFIDVIIQRSNFTVPKVNKIRRNDIQSALPVFAHSLLFMHWPDPTKRLIDLEEDALDGILTLF